MAKMEKLYRPNKEKLYRPNKEKVEARQRSMYGEDFPTLSMGEKLARILARSSTEDLK